MGLQPLRAALFTLMVVLSTFGCAPGARPEGSSGAPGPAPRAERPPRTVIVAVKVEPATLAPFSPAASGFSTNAPVRPFNAFLELVNDRAAVQPYLAEALPQLNTDTWQVFADGRMETRYRLRQGERWHDGAALSAEDFAFAWRVYTTPDLGFAAASTVPMAAIEDVMAPDSTTLVIRWKRPYPNASVLQVGGSTNLGLPPLPRHILESHYREARWDTFTILPYWTTEFVGLGPYKLDRWEQASFLEGEAFDGHVLGRPKIERIRFLFIENNNTVMANMRAETAHLATEGALTFEQALELKRDWATNNAGVFKWTAASVRYFVFQFRPDVVNPRAVLDGRVRKALAHTLDRVTISEAIWGGEGILLDSFFSPRTDYYPTIDRAITKYPYDPRTTERLMIEAGYARGADGIWANAADGRLAMEITTTGGGASDTERSAAASSWRQAGFDTSERNLPQALALDGFSRATFPAVGITAQSATEQTMSAAFATPQVARPENRWNGINRGGYSNPEYDRVVEAFNSVLDPNERIQQRATMARILTEELPGITLYYNLNPAPHLAVLSGPTPTGPDATGYVMWNVHEWDMK